MTQELLKLIVTRYSNDYELGNAVRKYYEFYESYKHLLNQNKIDEMFIDNVIKNKKTFKL